MLRLQNLCKTLPGGERVLFRGLSANLSGGEVTAVVGASGQGKSTLLRVIARLDVPDEGGLFLHGEPSDRWPVREWRSKVGYAAQQAVMFPGSVIDNLRASALIHKKPFDESAARRWMRDLLLERLDMEAPAGELSGGEKQRLALIRTLLMEPDVLLLDEVTSSLDEASKQATEAALIQWKEERGGCIVWVTHDREQARRHADRVLHLGEGRLLADLPAEAFFQLDGTAGTNSAND